MIPYKVWPKAIGVGESECAVSFSNFVAGKISLKKAYLRKRTIPYKVWPKVIEVGEFEPAPSFSKLTAETISLKEGHLREITMFYFFKISWILFIKWNVRSSDIKWSGKLLKKVVYVEVFLSFLETKSWGWLQMKIDHQLRKSTQRWKRLAADFAGLSKMSCTIVSCDILNVSGSNFTKMLLYEEFQYNTNSAERFRSTTLISNSQ